MDEFKTLDVNKRKMESVRLLKKFPDRIPVLVKPGNTMTPLIDKCKYLVPSDMSIGEFVNIIRKRVKLDSSKAMFVFVNNVLPPTSSVMRSIYEQHAESDGFLYITYSVENTFGFDLSFKFFELFK
jgi:GABA(A) receptor-associated protein